jgi:5-methylthioadenosine/S-adenosylhomocysteine deaminase
MLGEMRLALILQRGLRLDPTFPTAKDVLLMATLRGAKALGLDKKIGSIEEGKRADFVIFNGRSPRLLPEHDVVSNIVYSSNPLDITYTVVDGKVLYEHGRFSNLDIEKIFDVFGTKALALLKDAK